jgi:transposase
MTPTYDKRAAQASKLDPFKAYLRVRIDATKPDWIPATVLFRKIRAWGYKGKEGILKHYIRPFKITHNEPVRRLETLAGQQLQVDFTTIRRGRRELKAFVVTRGSVSTYVRFSEYERQEDWLTGIEGALHYFGCVLKELLFDNAECIMIERDAYGEGQHRWMQRIRKLPFR